MRCNLCICVLHPLASPSVEECCHGSVVMEECCFFGTQTCCAMYSHEMLRPSAMYSHEMLRFAIAAPAN